MVENDELGAHDMRAFCEKHKAEKCTWNQQTKTKPLARLWAFLSCQNDWPDKATHKAHIEHMSDASVAAAREQVERQPGAGPWLAAEVRQAAAA